MSTDLTSNKARVWDEEALGDVLDAYIWTNVDVSLREEDGKWVLEMNWVDDAYEYCLLPFALKRDQLPDHLQDSEIKDNDELADFVADLEQEEGFGDFGSLLQDLAPHLETPLMVLWAGKDDCRHTADSHAWLVRPGQDVEKLCASSF